MFVIPSKDSKKFSQPNLGDTQGNLWSTYNIDVTKNLGRVRTTRCQNVFNVDDDAQLTSNTAFAFFDWANSDTVFAAYNGAVFWGGNEPTDPFVQDALTNTPTATSGTRGDMKTFNGKLYVTTATKLKSLTSGAAAWVDVTLPPGTLTTGTHQLCVYGDRLYIVDQYKKVYSMNTSETVIDTGSYTLDLSWFNGHISWIVPGSNRIWIGFTKNDGTRGLVFEWDGQSENIWSKNYVIEAQGSAGCAIWNDIPYVLDIEGRLLAFNGSNFEEVARLPILQYDVLQSDYATNGSQKICHYNGIRFMNDAIYMNIDGRTTGTLGEQESFPGGVYEYTKENGLVHKYSPSLTEFGGAIKDYGAWYVQSAGAIFDATARVSNTTTYPASIMFGAGIKNNATSSWQAIFTDVIEPEIKQSGYFVSTWLETDQVTDVWKALVLKYRKFLGETDKIVVKYRVTKDVPLVEQNATWIDTSSLTVVGAEYSALAVGDEMEVIAGLGSGKCVHISAISNAGTTYTITLDDTVPGVAVSNTSHVRFQKWKKLPEINQTNVQFVNLPIPQYNKDTQIQIKVVAEWTGGENEIRELIVVNDTDQNAK